MTESPAKWPQIVAAIGASIGSFNLGNGLGWTSPVLPQISGDCKPCEIIDPLSDNEGSWISGLFPLGALLSSLISGFLMGTIGRRWTLIVMAIPSLAGWLILTFIFPLQLQGANWFYLGRVLAGVGSGAYILVPAIYISETSEITLRGPLGSMIGVFVTSGILFDNVVGSISPWFILTGICVAPPVLVASAMLLLPESPYFLVKRGRVSEAKDSLQWLRGKNNDIELEFYQLEKTIKNEEETGTASFKEFFTGKEYLKPLAILLFLMFLQQYSGDNAVIFNLTKIFEAAKTGLNPGLSASIVALDLVLGNVAAVFLVERTGRRILLMLSNSVMCISILALGVYFYVKENPSPSSDSILASISWLPLVSLVAFFFFFSLGDGPLPWMMTGEIFPNEGKNLGSSISMAFNWLCVFLVTKFAYNLQVALQMSGAFFFYGAICGLGCGVILMFLPETKGKTPEEMKQYFLGKQVE